MRNFWPVLLLSSTLAFCQSTPPPKGCTSVKKTLPTTQTSPCAARTVIHSPAPQPVSLSVQLAPPVAQQAPPPALDLSVALATFVEIKSTDQQLLLLEKQNEAVELALKKRRLEEVEVPQQGTNQYRAQTEREIADQQEADDALLTTAKVKLMGAEGTALKVNAWGNFIGNVASPLTAYLGRTQISTTTNMDQGSVSGSVSGGNLSNSVSTVGPTVTTSVSNSAAGGTGGQGGAGGNVSGSGNSTVHNTANGGNSSASSTGGSVIGSGNSKATGGTSSVIGSGNSKSSSNPTTTVANVGNSPTSVSTSNIANANPTTTIKDVGNPSQSTSTNATASPTQTTTANPTATGGDSNQSQSQTANPTASTGDQSQNQSQSQTTPPSN